MPAEWQDSAPRGTFLRPFVETRWLHIFPALISCIAVNLDDVGLDLGLLPDPRVLALGLELKQTNNAIASFIINRHVMDRLMRMFPWEGTRAESNIGRCSTCMVVFPIVRSVIDPYCLWRGMVKFLGFRAQMGKARFIEGSSKQLPCLPTRSLHSEMR